MDKENTPDVLFLYTMEMVSWEMWICISGKQFFIWWTILTQVYEINGEKFTQEQQENVKDIKFSGKSFWLTSTL